MWAGLVRFRYALLSLSVLALTALALGGWLGLRGVEARNHLLAAQSSLLSTETAVREGRLQPSDPALAEAVAVAARNTRAAHRLTSGALWRLAAALPGGCPLRSSAELTAAADQLTRGVVQPLAAMTGLLRPARHAGAIAVDVSAVRRASDQIGRMSERTAGLQADVAAVSPCGAVGDVVGIGSAQAELSGRLQRLGAMTVDFQRAAELLPPMLGIDAPRRYLLVVQNDAESRATGGILAGYGVLTASKGRLSLDTHNEQNLPGLGTTPVIRLSPEFEARYQRFHYARYWQNANLTPNFPTAGLVYAAMWKRGTGQQIDGVVAIDPTVLASLLSVVGPARMPDGQVVTGAGLVPLLESRIYALLPTNAQRDAYFAAAGEAIYHAVLSSRSSPMRLLPAFGRAAGQGRLLIWSRRAAEQTALEATPLAGVLPEAPGPFLAVVSQNGAGGKLDYWLHRTTTYALRQLPNRSGQAVVTASFTNSAPATGLPDYVRLRIEGGAPRNPPPGQNRLYVSIYGGVGSGFREATVDGRPVRMESELERGHGVSSLYITLNPGQTRTLRVVVSEPRWQPYVTVRSQPLINNERLTVTGAQVRPPTGSLAK